MSVRIAVLVATVACCFALSGCWDYKELEQQALLTGVGYDMSGNDHFMVVAFLDQQQSSAGDSGKEQTQLVAARARHAIEAYHLLSLQTPQFKYVSHVYSHLFSEAFARSSSFAEVIDRITRLGSIRRRTHLLITPDHVEDVFSLRLPGADSTARGLPDLVTQANLVQMAPRVDLNEFVYESTLPGMDSMLPEIHIVQARGRPVLKAAGAAVFHELKMVGYLTPEDVRALLWIMQKSGHSFLAFPSLKTSETAYIRTEEIHTSIKTSVRGDRPVADVSVQLAGTLALYRGTHDLRKTDIKRLEITASRFFRRSLLRVVKKTQSMGVDPAGFGVLVRAQVGPAVWRHRYAHWSEEGYPRMTVHIRVHTHIRSEEATSDPISIQQAENGPTQP